MTDETPKKEETKQEEKQNIEKKDAEHKSGIAATGPVGAVPENGSSDADIPEKFKGFIDQIKEMSVVELHELVKALEVVFGVSASAVAASAVAASTAGVADEEEKSSFNIELKEVGGQKIAVIKAIKEAFGLGLKEAKDLAEGAPVMLKEGVSKEDAEEIKGKIEAAGGSVELK